MNRKILTLLTSYVVVASTLLTGCSSIRSAIDPYAEWITAAQSQERRTVLDQIEEDYITLWLYATSVQSSDVIQVVDSQPVLEDYFGNEYQCFHRVMMTADWSYGLKLCQTATGQYVGGTAESIHVFGQESAFIPVAYDETVPYPYMIANQRATCWRLSCNYEMTPGYSRAETPQENLAIEVDAARILRQATQALPLRS